MMRPRTTACDCERAMEPGLPQKLYLMADQTIVRHLAEARLARLKPLLSSDMTDDQILDELTLSTLSRLPNDRERASFKKHLSGNKDRPTAFTDLLWALINTTEFISNH